MISRLELLHTPLVRRIYAYLRLPDQKKLCVEYAHVATAKAAAKQ